METLYRKLLKKYDDEIVINIILVNETMRPAFLLESANFKDKDYFLEMVDIINQINCLNINKKLLIKRDSNDSPRYFIYLNNSFVNNTISNNKNSVNENKHIAKFLGFQCIGHDFGNEFKDRMSHTISIYNHDTKNQIDLVVEVCELYKEPVVIDYYNDFASDIQTLFSKIGKNNYEVSYKVKTLLSRKELLKNYFKLESTDKDDLLENILEDFKNHYIGEPILDESVLRDKLKLLKEETISETDFIKLIYLYSITMIDQLIDQQFENLFRTRTRTNENLQKFYEKVKDWDKEYWSTENYKDMIGAPEMDNFFEDTYSDKEE